MTLLLFVVIIEDSFNSLDIVIDDQALIVFLLLFLCFLGVPLDLSDGYRLPLPDDDFLRIEEPKSAVVVLEEIDVHL